MTFMSATLKRYVIFMHFSWIEDQNLIDED